MKILIIEDKPQHLLSAQKFADECGHEVVIAKGYDEAMNFFYSEQGADVVMSDLMMPSSMENIPARMHGEFADIEQPYGFALILTAISFGIKTVGILTDGNHHTHPMVNALDPLDRGLKMGDVKIEVMQMFGNGANYSTNHPVEHRLHVPEGDPLEGAKDWSVLFKELASDN